MPILEDIPYVPAFYFGEDGKTKIKKKKSSSKTINSQVVGPKAHDGRKNHHHRHRHHHHRHPRNISSQVVGPKAHDGKRSHHHRHHHHHHHKHPRNVKSQMVRSKSLNEGEYHHKQSRSVKSQNIGARGHGGGRHGRHRGGHSSLSAAKAREILHDGTVRGNPITDRQRKFFAWKGYS